MPALLRSDDIQHASKAMIAALGSATALIEGNTNSVRTRNIKPMSGITMAEIRTAEVKFGHSVCAARAAAVLLCCWVDMTPPQRSPICRIPARTEALKET